MGIAQRVAKLVAIERRYILDWEGFNHPRFLEEENDDKREASALARELLAEDELARLLGEQAYDEIIARIEKIGQQTNLLYLSVPAQGDLGVLYAAELEKESFCQQIADLIYGPDLSETRLDRYVAYCQAHEIQCKWTLPTLLLFLVHPESEYFVKPTAVDWLLRFMESPVKRRSVPSGTVYAEVKRLASELLTGLASFGPRDLIDVQGIVWTAFTIERGDGRLEKDLRECLATYPTTTEGKRHLSLYGQARTVAGEHYAEILAAADAGEDVTERVLEWLLPYGEGKYARDNNAWLHWAPVYRSDPKGFVNKGQVPTEAWPRIAGSILDFVRRCVERPEELAEACNDFVADPDGKGFQAGTLTPILNALSPGDFVLINSKLIQVLQKVWQFEHTAQLSDYPEANRLLQTQLAALDDILRPMADELGISSGDLFDMYCHWTVAVKDGKTGGEERTASGGENDVLAEPFHAIFGTRDEAEWAFDLMRDTLERLGVEGPDDPRFAVTLRKQGTFSIHVDFGMWLVLVFTARSVDEADYELGLALRQEGLEDEKDPNTWTSATDDDEPATGHYYLTRKSFVERQALYQKQFSLALETAMAKFGHWNATPFRGAHVEALAQAIFDASLRDRLFAEGISEDEVENEGYTQALEQDDAKRPIYSLSQIESDTGFAVDTLERWVRAIERKGQAVFYGPPGTGKTFIAEHLARHLIGGTHGFYELVQFHPAYAYEDFIQGLRPRTEDGQLCYEMVHGRFLAFVRKAERLSPGDICVLIIDEINRANLSRVLGELMYLLEYRDRSIPLSGGGELRIPANVRIIGTMNTADRSIALVDHALRRRFAFLKLEPKYELLKRYHEREQTGFPTEGLIGVLKRVNDEIKDPNYSVGVSFFMDPKIAERIADIWRMEIEPYLEELFFDHSSAVDTYAWGKVERDIWMRHD